MRVVHELKGIHSATKRLADGSRRTYYYAWKGGPRLEGEPGSPEFLASYHAATTERKQAPKGTFFSLIAAYRTSSEFTTLAPKTQKDYRRYLQMIEDEFGDMPLRVLQDIRTRGDFKEWRDAMAEHKRKADLAWTVLARVLSWAKDGGRIAVNVAERGRRLYSSDRAEVIWTEDLIARALAGLPEHLRRVFLMALWTGQRQGDLLRLPWSAYDGRALSVKQSKTGARVTIRVGQPLREMLDALPRKDSTVILLSSDGLPWTSDGFRSSWRKAMERLGITGVTFHDIRGSAITRLAEAGCTESEIASVSGHDISHVGNVLSTYLGKSARLAETAIVKLERAERERKLQTNDKPVKEPAKSTG